MKPATALPPRLLTDDDAGIYTGTSKPYIRALAASGAYLDARKRDTSLSFDSALNGARHVQDVLSSGIDSQF